MFVSRVISRREAPPDVTYEWLDKLREENPPTVYDIDPFCEVFKLHENVYSLFSESADGMGDTWHHLIIGPEKAMLIDTGFGIGNLKGLVDMLTGGMELIVVITHEHLDHCYGNFQFDTVYGHEYGYERVMNNNNPHIWDKLYDESGNGKWLRFKKEDIIPYKEYNYIAVKDGHIFDLGGGHEVELIHTPGHAPGGASFLDKKNRILFSGAMHSAIISTGTGMFKPFPYKEYSTVEKFRNSLMVLKERLDEFNVVFPAHEIQCLDAKTFIPDLLELCNTIIDDPEGSDSSYTKESGVKMCVRSLRSATVSYTPEGVRAP